MRSRRLLEIRERVVRVLQRLAAELNASIYLFGSYARGDHILDSDVDIVVVSERFKGIDYARRVEIVRVKLPPDMDFDIIPLTPEEFRAKLRKAFFRDISRYWVRIS